MSLPKFIAIVGREGSGKDSYGDYLATKGYMHVSAGDVLRERARESGFTDPIPRTVLSQIGDEMKKEFGPSPITESTIFRYEELKDKYPGGLVISGLRRTGEIEAFKTHDAVVLWIDADDERRYANENLRARGDEQSIEDFIERGKEEYFGSTDGGKDGVNLRQVELLSDYKICNDGSLEDLFEKADKAIG